MTFLSPLRHDTLCDTHSVIGNTQRAQPIVALQVNPDAVGLCMLDDVGQRLTRRAVEHIVRVGAQAVGPATGIKLDGKLCT